MDERWRAERQRERTIWHLDDAKSHFSDGNLEEALDQCEIASRALRGDGTIDPDDSLLREIRELFYQIEETEKFPEVHDSYRSAEKIFEEAESALRKGEYSTAIERYETARQRYENLGRSLVDSWTGIPSRETVRRRIDLSDRTVDDITEGRQDLPWTDFHVRHEHETQVPAVPPTKLLLDLVHVGQLVGRPPTPSDIEEHGDFPVEWYFIEFESWAAALDAAGLVTRRDE